MIAAVRALLALFLVTAAASGADDAGDAARELARKAAAFAGRGEPVSVSWRNLSTLPSGDLATARIAFETGLREAGGRTSDIAPIAEVRITLSENQTHYLLVAEARKGGDRQVWMAGWKRGIPRPPGGPHPVLTRTPIWEQSEPILDVAGTRDRLVILSPSGVRWSASGITAAIQTEKPWPRDLRGRLRIVAGTVEAHLPGLECRSVQPGALECRSSEEAWTLDSGTRSLLIAHLAPGRNNFDGRVTTQAGQRKTVPPFFSAAAVELGGETVWVLALTDGRAQLFDTNWEGDGVFSGWGSDIVGTDVRCGGNPVVLATRPGDGRDGDAIQPYMLVNRLAVASGPALEFPGPITALWPYGGEAAVAIVRNSESGKYIAYLVSTACGS